ncbi:hypothetical protein [Lysobacter sp.]|uniref:hypothetical protein n=1 Tax=Lysobacter sp. TaxID=72226 RepID=UPI002D2B77CE|nr:hypothetical protein [Lysobacter sp.]HZX76825.1 hypothetical protein [Lysobacter sp.]
MCQIDWNIVIALLQVLLSTPVILGAVFGVAMGVFWRQIRDLIDRIEFAKVGNTEVRARQKEPVSTPPQNLPKVHDQPHIEVPEGDVDCDERLRQLNEQWTHTFNDERARAYLWEYRFINAFLVPRTQAVLDWLAASQDDRGSTSIALFDTWYKDIIPSATERQAILDALSNHVLIVIANDTITVTPKGLEYIQWRTTVEPPKWIMVPRT